MTDADLDREIQTALGVEPSSQFVARVRTEIANQPVALRVPFGWAWAIAAACTVIVAISVTNGVKPEVARLKPSPTEMSTRPEMSKSPEITPPEISTPTEIANPANVSEPDARTSEMPKMARTGTPAKTLITHEPAMPEVIIAPEDVQAFQQLIISVRERRFEASFDERPPSTPWVMTELSVPPLIIEPLELPAANN